MGGPNKSAGAFSTISELSNAARPANKIEIQ
jgi:hypothetical protein